LSWERSDDSSQWHPDVLASLDGNAVAAGRPAPWRFSCPHDDIGDSLDTEADPGKAEVVGEKGAGLAAEKAEVK